MVKGKMDLLISQENIAEKIKEVAHFLNKEYENREVTIIIVMKGAICLAADLIRHLTFAFGIECIKASSYGHGGIVRGELAIQGIENLDLTSKDILVIDDIFDSGSTMKAIIDKLQILRPKTLKSLVLLLKKVPRKTEYLPDYVLFEVENLFVVGYGLDYKERYRGLPGIYSGLNFE